MKTAFLLILTLCSALSAWSATPRQAVKYSVLIVDGMNNHDWARGTRILKGILTESGLFDVDVSTTPPAGAPPGDWANWKPDFRKYNCVISNFNGGHTAAGTRWPADVEKAFEDYVRGGGGFVSFHAANNAFLNWPAYNEMIGLGWRDKSYGPSIIISPEEEIVRIPAGEGRGPGHGPEHDFPLRILAKDHPITRGMPALWMHPREQLSHGQHGPAKDITVLTYAWSRDTRENEPMDWVIPYGKGRVYVTLLGHLWNDGPDTTLRCAGFQTLFTRGVEWAACGHVTYPIPVDFPTATEIKSRPGPATRPLMKNFIGINGHTVQFKPDLYRPVCGLVRDYHPVEWDLGKDTSQPAPFPLAKNRVDWSQVYGSWRNQGWDTNVSLMFESIPRQAWKDMPKDAASYGLAFAREFGPSGQRKLVDSVEIGNEPGEWPDDDYINMFRSMAEGIRHGDPKLRIATCALTTGKSERYAKSAGCLSGVSGLFDILSVHSYAQLENWPTWRRSYPEDPALKNYLQNILALCQWRDTHAPGKPVWLTEFGYDSSTRPAPASGDFSRWVGVTDTQQAQWLVRSLLVFSSMPLDRAYIYFFNDEDKPGLHASSGITRNFQPKPSFLALAQLQRILGGFRFERIARNEPGVLRVQEYLNPENPKLVAWVAWSPTGTGISSHRKLTGLPGTLTDVQTMRLAPENPVAAYEKPSAWPVTDGTLDMEIGESPVYLLFAKP